MALDTTFYSKKQFDVAYKPETTTGTENVATMAELNIDDWSVDMGVERFLGQRHGAGRTKKLVDNYVNAQGKVKNLNVSGLYDTTMGTVFLENVCNLATSSTPDSIDIPGNFTGTVATQGETPISDNIHTLTMALCSPVTNKSSVLPGCVVNRFKMIMNGAEDGGRCHFEADLMSRGNWALEHADIASRVAYPAVTTHRTLYDLNAAASAVFQVGGADVTIYKLEIEIIANVKFVGYGYLGVPDHIYRAAPNYDVNIIVGMKYDANTEPLFKDQTEETTIVCAFHNAAWATATFGFLATYCQIAEDFDIAEVEEGAFFDLPLTAMAHTSGDIFQIVP